MGRTSRGGSGKEQSIQSHRSDADRLWVENALKKSEERIRSFLGNADAVTYVKDKGGRFVVLSPWYEAQYKGKKRFIGKTPYDVFPKKYANIFQTNDRKVMEAGIFLEFQEPFPTVDKVHTSTTFKFPVFDSEGNICGTCGISTLLTDRKQVEELRKKAVGIYREFFKSVMESETKYRTLFEYANDAIFLLKGDYFVECNKKSQEVYGCGEEDIIGKTWYHFSPERQPDGTLSKDKGTEKRISVEQGVPEVFEWKHLKYDGTPYDAEISLNRVVLKGEVFF